MSPEVWASIAAAGGAWAAAVVAIVSAWFTLRAVKAAEAQTRIQSDQTALQQQAARAAVEQTDLQRQVARDATQPYVWVDVRADAAQGTLLHLVLGNSGPSFAHNIRVRIDPPLPTDPEMSRPDRHHRIFEGITTLGPGQRHRWAIGRSFEILPDGDDTGHTVTIDAEGPHGALPQLTYSINLADFRGTLDVPDGSLHQVRETLKKIEKKLPDPRKPLRVAVEDHDDPHR